MYSGRRLLLAGYYYHSYNVSTCMTYLSDVNYYIEWSYVYFNQRFGFLSLFLLIAADLTRLQWKWLRNIPACSWALTFTERSITDLRKDNREL
jgi:hypothetical protein